MKEKERERDAMNKRTTLSYLKGVKSFRGPII